MQLQHISAATTDRQTQTIIIIYVASVVVIVAGKAVNKFTSSSSRSSSSSVTTLISDHCAGRRCGAIGGIISNNGSRVCSSGCAIGGRSAGVGIGGYGCGCDDGCRACRHIQGGRSKRITFISLKGGGCGTRTSAGAHAARANASTHIGTGSTFITRAHRRRCTQIEFTLRRRRCRCLARGAII